MIGRVEGEGLRVEGGWEIGRWEMGDWEMGDGRGDGRWEV